MTEPDRRADDDKAMRDRLTTLARDLSRDGAGKGGNMPRPAEVAVSGMGQAISLGVRVMSEFVAAIVVGAFIGWLIDRGLNSSPAALILFIGLGTAAGFWNVYRVATKTGGR